eukprot:403341012
MAYTRRAIVYLILVIVTLSLLIVESNSVQSQTSVRQGSSQQQYQRPSFLSESSSSDGKEPHVFAMKSRGRSRSSYFSFGYSSSYGYYYGNRRPLTWSETLIALGVIVGFVLVMGIIITICEKCGCCKNEEQKSEDINNHDHHTVIEYNQVQTGYPPYDHLHTEIDH